MIDRRNRNRVGEVVLVMGAVFFWLGGCGGSVGALGPLGVNNEQLGRRMREVLYSAAVGQEAALRSNALESLALLDELEVPEVIRKGLHDKEVVVRFAAAVAAGDRKDYTARHLLEKLLWDKSDAVKLAAGYALERLGDKRFGKWFDAALMGSDPQLAAQSCMLLGKLGVSEYRQDSAVKLWQVLRQPGQQVAVKLQSAEALARLGDKKILRKLLAYAGSGYADDRLMTIAGLEAIGGVDVAAMLTVLVEDSQIEVQLAAVRALGPRQTGDMERQMARQAMRYVDSEGDALATERVRGLAVLALGRVGEDEDGRLLYKAMGTESAYVRLAAARGAIDFLRQRRAL